MRNPVKTHPLLVTAAVIHLILCSGFLAPSACADDYPTEVLSDNPVVWWRLGELSGSNVLDSAGSVGGPYDGIYETGVQLDQPGALYSDADRAARFDGSATSKVAVAYEPDLNPSGAFSVEAWVMVEGGGGTERNILTSLEEVSSNEKYGYELTVTPSNRWRFTTGRFVPGQTSIDGPEVVTSSWTHLVGVYNGSSNALYVNGTLAGTVPVTSFNPVESGFPVPLFLGAGGSEDAPTGDSFFIGRIDEVAIYHTALSAQRIQAHYRVAQLPSRLVGFWDFEDAADLGKDRSLQVNHLATFGMVTNAPAGAIGQAVALGGGTGDFLGLAGDTGPGTDFLEFPAGIPTNDSYTISVWIKPDAAAGAGDAMISWGNFGTMNQVNAFRMNGVNNVFNYWWNNDLQGASTTNLKDGNWHHLAAAYVNNSSFGSDQFIYLNGQLIGQRDSDNLLNALPENFRIGSANGNGETFDGQLDEVMVFDYGMNAAEIELLRQGNYGVFTNELASYWTGPHGSNGTYNLYQVVGHDYGDPLTWAAAHAVATNSVDPLTGSGKRGHLVSIADYPENFFVQTIKPRNVDTWIGLTDDPAFGGSQAGNDRNGGWVWAGTSEPYTYNNFSPGQPDNSGDGVTMWQDIGRWDDTGNNGPVRVYIIEWDIGASSPIPGARTTAPIPPPVLPAVLPGPAGEAGAFGGYWVRNNGAVSTLALATNSLMSGTGEILSTNRVPVVNHHDPEKAGDIDKILFPDEGPYWANLVGQADDHFVAVYKGQLNITEPGNYTFGVHSDDGFALRIRGAEFFGIDGAGLIDRGDPSTIYFPTGTGNSDTRGHIYLLAGAYPIEFVTWNGVGGAYHELYGAPGIRIAANENTDRTLFNLINAPAQTVDVPAVSNNLWEVWMSDPGAHGAIGNTNTAWNAITNYLPTSLGGNQLDPDGLDKTVWPAINFGTGNQGSTGGDNAYPKAGGANFALFARTTITVTNAGEYVFGFQGDDGGWMRVVGQNWKQLVFKNLAVGAIVGDRLTLDAGTGNSRMFGSIDLVPGDYEVQVLNWQGAGGFHWEVLNGVRLLPNQRVASSLLDNVGETITNEGFLQLVAPPASSELLVTSVVYDQINDRVTLTWASEPSRTYRIVGSLSSDPNNFDPGTWFDVETGINSGGTETMVTLPNLLGTPWKAVPSGYVVLRVAEE